MATMVDRPRSLLRESPVEPIIPQRRLRDPEIIDVDSLDSDGEEQASGSFASVRRRVRARQTPDIVSEVIELSDDDDSDAPIAGSSRLISPPPRRVRANIPPIPPIPAHLAAHTSLPLRRHAPPHPTSANNIMPPVRAHDRPFDFGISFIGSSSRAPSSGPSRTRPSNGPSRDGSSSRQPPPRLGLGGALIASRNARLQRERENVRRQQMADYQHTQRNPYNRPMQAAARTGGFPWHDALVHLYLGNFDSDFADARRKEVEYKQEYTHPVKPEPGFVFNFGVSDDAQAGQNGSTDFPVTSQDNPIVIDDDDEVNGSSSKGKGKEKAVADSSSTFVKTLLVCSRCLDPLLLGESTSKLGSAGEKAKRIWSLRCGHLIDGKCLEALSVPDTITDAPVDRKGKGKAVEPPDQPEAFDLRNSIRSRLRSFHGDNSRTLLLPDSLTLLKERKPAASKSGNGVEEEHRWRCPVVSCGREHVSVRVAGVWGPAKPEMGRGDGVIGVFV
ncbi:hypothetical protein WG66_010268 [Moniliophthora roreri]|uniref:Uncharacterized protein n=1 Tax=Moniliophthora roreri TaxID=221103 RepID=A0A0W0F7H0_MONRR|nr:hypothetical protein WG66_010268 [Moniliophthora roreri]